MSEHYKQSEIGEWRWFYCTTCERNTRHVIVRATSTAGKKGPCLEHAAPELTKDQVRRREIAAHERQNPTLFGPID